MTWSRRVRAVALQAQPRSAPSPGVDDELAGLYQVYDPTTRSWDVIDPEAGRVIKSKRGGPWPSVARKEA